MLVFLDHWEEIGMEGGVRIRDCKVADLEVGDEIRSLK